MAAHCVPIRRARNFRVSETAEGSSFKYAPESPPDAAQAISSDSYGSRVNRRNADCLNSLGDPRKSRGEARRIPSDLRKCLGELRKVLRLAWELRKFASEGQRGWFGASAWMLPGVAGYFEGSPRMLRRSSRGFRTPRSIKKECRWRTSGTSALKLGSSAGEQRSPSGDFREPVQRWVGLAG